YPPHGRPRPPPPFPTRRSSDLRTDARAPDPLEPAQHVDEVVVLRQLAAEVDRHAREHEVPDTVVVAEQAGKRLVAGLLEVREIRSAEHTCELQSRFDLVCCLLL